MESISTQLFLKVLSSLAQYAGEQALRHFKTPVAIAIKATAGDFAKYPKVSDWLHDWCSSPEFFQLQGSLKEGDRIEPAEIAKSFAAFVGSVNPDAGDRIADEVLPVFFRRIDEQLLGSPGLAIIEQRSELRQAELAISLQQILGFVKSLDSRPLSIASNNEPSRRDLTEIAFDARLDVVKSMLDSGQPKAGRLILAEIEPTIQQGECSTQLRFRLETLTGNCLLQLGEPSAASERLRTAVALNRKDARSKANLSQALAWSERDPVVALQYAREAVSLAPEDAYVASVLIQRLAESNLSEEVDEFIRAHSNYISDAFFLRAVSEYVHARGRSEEAINLLTANLKPGLPFAPAWELLGRCLLNPVQKKLHRDLPIPWLHSKEIRQRILAAEKALSQAIDLLEGTDAQAAIAALYVNRGLARSWLGRRDAAEADYDHALSLKPDFDEAKPARALMLIDKREFQAAIELLGTVDPSHASADVHALLGIALLESGQPRNAIEHLDPIIRSVDLEPRAYIRTVEVLADAHRRLGQMSIAEQLVNRTAERFHNEVEAQTLLAEHVEKSGDPDRARRIFEEAYQLASPVKHPLVCLDLASFYWRQNLFTEAARMYEQVAGPGMHPTIRFQYAVSLLNAGQIDKSYELARDTRLQEGFDLGLAEVEARICEEIGDLETANSLLTEIISRRTDRAAYFRVRIATNCYRMGDERRCRELVYTIAASELSGAPELLMQTAKLRHWLGLPDSLDFAYEAWRAGSTRPEIALAYAFISLARQTDDREILEVDAASEGCRVHLKRGTEERVVDLVAEASEELPAKRVGITSALGRRLVGLRRGIRLASAKARTIRLKTYKANMLPPTKIFLTTSPLPSQSTRAFAAWRSPLMIRLQSLRCLRVVTNLRQPLCGCTGKRG